MEYINIYSVRKFFGVPDGCYVIAKNAEKYKDVYQQDYSSDTACFLLKRIEYGCSAVYADRMKNEKRIDESDIMLMSYLTKTLLEGIDYKSIKKKRKANFEQTHLLYKKVNLIDPHKFLDNLSVPMVYPLVYLDPDLVDKLNKNGIYTGRWWKSVVPKVPQNSFENLLSQYMIPLPIDQRYDFEIIKKIKNIIFQIMK